MSRSSFSRGLRPSGFPRAGQVLCTRAVGLGWGPVSWESVVPSVLQTTVRSQYLYDVLPKPTLFWPNPGQAQLTRQ